MQKGDQNGSDAEGGKSTVSIEDKSEATILERRSTLRKPSAMNFNSRKSSTMLRMSYMDETE